MLDLSHIPQRWAGAYDQQVFPGSLTTATTLNQVWTKPRGIQMVQILCIGQGGNGAAGVVGATATGGAGGGCGSVMLMTISAFNLPDILYVGAGTGGAGVVIDSKVATKPYGTVFGTTPALNDVVAFGGGAIGNATTAGATPTIASSAVGARGTYTLIAGALGGTAGAAGATGGQASFGTYTVGGGGGGGGNTTTAGPGGTSGSTATPNGQMYAIPGGVGGTSGVAGGNGSGGSSDISRLVFTGGGGGGSGFFNATTSNGGNGGNGGYGCGGGGGGGAFTGMTAGLGGKGGPGLVIITSW